MHPTNERWCYNATSSLTGWSLLAIFFWPQYINLTTQLQCCVGTPFTCCAAQLNTLIALIRCQEHICGTLKHLWHLSYLTPHGLPPLASIRRDKSSVFNGHIHLHFIHKNDVNKPSISIWFCATLIISNTVFYSVSRFHKYLVITLVFLQSNQTTMLSSHGMCKIVT